MILYILEYGHCCEDCGTGEMVGAFSSMDRLESAAKRYAEKNGDDIERYGLDLYVTVHELNVDEVSV